MIDGYTIDMQDGNFILNKENIGPASKVFFSGKNNILIIANGVRTKTIEIDFRASNSIVFIDSSKAIVRILMGHGSTVYIGRDTSCTNATHLTAAEEKDIYVGPECMLAENVYISNTDGHPIFNEWGARINYGKNVIIGEHVWIGRDSEILKGAEINSGSIIAARSVVTKKITSNSLAAGTPAKVIKENISFERITTVRKPLISKNNDKLKIYPHDHLGDLCDLEKIKNLARYITTNMNH
jgi:acetyltransferase-like isoleucine patch superfamily enzyme